MSPARIRLPAPGTALLLIILPLLTSCGQKEAIERETALINEQHEEKRMELETLQHRINTETEKTRGARPEGHGISTKMSALEKQKAAIEESLERIRVIEKTATEKAAQARAELKSYRDTHRATQP